MIRTSFLGILFLSLAYCVGHARSAPPIDTKLDHPHGVAVGGNGNIYVANTGSVPLTSNVTEYATGGTAPIALVSQSQVDLLQSPLGIAVDQHGNVYVVQARSVLVFQAIVGGGLKLAGTLTDRGGFNFTGVAIDAGGDVYVTENAFITGKVAKYAAGSRSEAKPMATITGARTGLRHPTAIAIDAKGVIYVANSSPDSITRYAPGSNGDVAPIATIAGPKTSLGSPAGVAVNAAGTVYVANFASSVVTEYAAGSNGDVAPVATISGSKTGLSNPSGLALDAHGAIYVTNYSMPSVTVYSDGGVGEIPPRFTIPPPSYPAPTAEGAKCPLVQGLPRDTTPNLSETGSFRLTRGDMCRARAGHTATLLANGEVLLAGGDTSYTGDTPSSSAELYDPQSETFRWTGAMSMRRSIDSSAVMLVDARVLVVGGLSSGIPAAADGNPVAEIYDPSSGMFTRIGRMLSSRAGFTATGLKDGRVLIAGGWGGVKQVSLASAEAYDPGSGSFFSAGTMKQSRGGHVAVRLRDGRVLIAGGMANPFSMQGNFLASAEIYDPKTETFGTTGSMQVKRFFPIATLLKDGKVLITGGEMEESLPGIRPGPPSLEVYDPVTGSFAAPVRMADTMMTATLLTDGKVLLAGSKGTVSAELFDPTTGAFAVTAAIPYPCPGRATLLRDGNVLFTGGIFCNSARSVVVPLGRPQIFHEKQIKSALGPR